MLCIFPRNQTKQRNPFNHSKPKPLGKINHSKPKIFPRNQTQTQETQRITIPSFRHLKNHSNSENHHSFVKPKAPFVSPFLPCRATSLRQATHTQQTQTHFSHAVLFSQKPGLLCFFHRTQTKHFVWFLWKKHSKPMLCFSFCLIGKICFRFPSISSSSSPFLQLLLF